MTTKNIRTCIIKRTKHHKTQLWKFNLVHGQIVFDATQELEGRSCYVFPSEENLHSLVKKALLTKRMKAPVAESLYQELADWLQNVG